MIKRLIRKLVAASGLPEQIGYLSAEIESLKRGVDAPRTSQGMQLFLALHYQEMAHYGYPFPAMEDIQFRCYSQNGEDGLLLYLFALVGTTNKRVVEICAGDGIECNAANLIINHGWRGLLIDGNEQLIAKGREFYARCQDTLVSPPTLVSSWITPQNVNELVAKHGFVGDIDLLSLDMDGIDYWVWNSLTAVSPRVVVAEVNGIWGPNRSVSVPCDPAFRIDYSRPPFFCGASLSAFAKLGRERGYRLVGGERLGFNVVFLRDDVGTGIFPEISPVEYYERNPRLRTWSPNLIPSATDRPEFGRAVEV